MPQVGLVAGALGLAFVVGVPPAADAGVVIVNNRIIRTDVDSPYLPNDRSDCEDFRKTVQDTRDEVHKAHEACLASNRGGASSSEATSTTLDGRKIARCSVAACQELHTARDDLSHSASTGYSRCMAEVRSRESDRRESFGSGRGEDFDYAIGRLKNTQLAAVRSLVRRKLGEIIDDTFSYGSPLVKKGLNVGATSNFLWERTSGVRASCAATGKHEVSRECDKEIVATLHDLSSRVPAWVRTDPAIGLIQTAMIERLGQIHRDVMRDMGRVQEDMDAVTETRGRRRGALIENR